MRKEPYSFLTSLVVIPTFAPGLTAEDLRERNEIPIADDGVEDEIPELPNGIDPPDLEAPRQTRSVTRARLSLAASTQTTTTANADAPPQTNAMATNVAAEPAAHVDGLVGPVGNVAPATNGAGGSKGKGPAAPAPSTPVISLDSDEDDRAIQAGIHGPPSHTVHRVQSNASIASNQSSASRASSSKSYASSKKSAKAAGKKALGLGDNPSTSSLKVLASLSAKLKKGKIPLREKKSQLISKGADSDLAFQRSMRAYHLYQAHALASEVVGLQEADKLREKAIESEAAARKHNILSKSIATALSVKEASKVNKKVGKAREKVGKAFVKNHDEDRNEDSDNDEYNDAVETSSVAERMESLQPFGDDEDDEDEDEEDIDVDAMVVDTLSGDEA